MAEAAAEHASGRRVVWLAGLALLAAGALFAHDLAQRLPAELWWRGLLHPDADDLRQILVQYSVLPRFAAGLLGGAALGLAGVLFQQVLRNPLAEPGTLGVFAGAKLALTLASLVAPVLLTWGQGVLAFGGGAASVALVLLLSRRGGLAPLTVILAGLVVTLYLDASSKILLLFNHAALSDLFLWQAGALQQNNWGAVTSLLPGLALGLALTLLLLRPLTLLDLEEEGARSLGLSLAAVRLLALTLAVLLSASVVSTLGVIGFIGLAGPAIARHAGARRFRDRLLWGPLLSAGLLVLTDQLVQAVSPGDRIPTGAVTAILGAPLLLWLLSRLRPASAAGGNRFLAAKAAAGRNGLWLAAGILVLGAAVWLALSLGRVPEGWRWSFGAELEALWPWRAPRVAAALAAGFMLAQAGVVLQRLTGNPLASPELLGISSGAALALMVAAFAVPDLGRFGLTGVAAAGALATLLAILSLGRRSAYAPEHLLLAGVALATLQGSFLAVVLLGGDPRTVLLLSWVAGSTYGLTLQEAAVTCLCAAVLGLAVPFTARWLAILPLGAEASGALGVSLRHSRFVLLLLTAALTAAATLTVGPLSFVGLMAPHLVRLIGIHRPLAQLFAAGLLGAVLMVAADWAGRQLAFPWQLPAGVVATFMGGAYFLWLLQRRR